MALVTGHGKTRLYLHRFKKTESAVCLCNKEDQILDHILNKCTRHKTQRDLFKEKVLKAWSWPVSKKELITKQLKSFLTFTEIINLEH